MIYNSVHGKKTVIFTKCPLKIIN